MAALRTLARGRSSIHLLGVDSSRSKKGSEALFALIQERKPKHVLMESFAADDPVPTSAEVPYRKQLHPVGLAKALELAKGRDFRENFSCEAMGVLAALSVGADVLFADRWHSISFDRLIARMSVDETLSAVAVATEAFASRLAECRLHSSDAQPAAWAQDQLLQNVLCKSFPELWGERHRVMASVVQRAAKASEHDVVLVVGSSHVDPVADALEVDVDAEALLAAPEDTGSWDDQLKKRAAIGALVISTKAFPVHHVLPDFDDLLPEAKEVVKPVYLRCRQAIRGRLGDFDSQSSQVAAEQLRGSSQVVTLEQLEAVCSQLAT